MRHGIRFVVDSATGHRFATAVVFGLLSLATASGCGSDSGDDSAVTLTGGVMGAATTGGVVATGGTVPVGATGGQALGMMDPLTGGVVPVTGGDAPLTGGAVPVTGGDAPVTGGDAPTTGGTAAAEDPSLWNDPGPSAFVPVPEGEVAAECGLDIGLLKSAGLNNAAVFRYGKLCWSNGAIDRAYGVFSVTKTVAGTVMAAAYWDTRDNAERMLPSDPISKWGGSGSIRISEYAGMVTSGGRTWGSHRFAYDTLGSNLARTGAPMEVALSQGSVSGATRLEAVRDGLFEKLGVKGSWPTGTWGTGANISLTDMARIGIAHSHNGWWNGEQVLDPDWSYWMTHPHWEDATTSYGMYMWLNHRGNGSGIGGDLSPSGAGPPDGDPCAPAAVWQRYPHPPSESPDCNATNPSRCAQMYDTGVFSAQGLGGQFMVAHRGLDLVIVAQNFSSGGGPQGLWDLVRPSLVSLDPMYKGDETAFCEAYGNGNYAPDMIVAPVQPDAQ